MKKNLQISRAVAESSTAANSVPRGAKTPSVTGVIALLLALLFAGPGAASPAASERLTARASRAAVELERMGRGDVVVELVRQRMEIDLADLSASGRSLGDLVVAAGLARLSGLSPERSLELLDSGWTLSEFVDRLGLGAMAVSELLGPVAASLEGGVLALTGRMHHPNSPGEGPGHDDREDDEQECDSSPGHGPWHDDDCERVDNEGPGDDRGPHDGMGDGHGPHDFENEEECEHDFGPGPHGHGCESEFSEEIEVDPFVCLVGEEVACLGDGRFEITVEWADFAGNFGHGQQVDLPSRKSALFWFFDPENYEVMVKVLDGCALNGHYWLYSAAMTNVEYALTAIDSHTGLGKTYFSPLHRMSRAIGDVQALAACQ